MAPLAGKPPYATDEPDSFYETPAQPTRRQRQPAPQDPNKRTSAYDVYENYLDDGDKDKGLNVPPAPGNRNSGVGALGMGLLNMDDSDDDDSDDDDAPRKAPANQPPTQSKNAALAAAVTSGSSPTSLSQTRGAPAHLKPLAIPANNNNNNPFDSVVPQGGPSMPSPGLKPIAAPRPGYAAPIAALNLAGPEPNSPPAPTSPNMTVPPAARLPMPQPLMMPNGPPGSDPFANPPRPAFAAGPSPSASPAPSMPHPLHPPITPITPVFIRPKLSTTPDVLDEKNASAGPSVKFSPGMPIPRKQIMRSNSEDPLLPNRGEKGDDFWRRFSMVAKTDTIKNESSWLKSMRSGSSRHSRWVWCVSIALLIIIAGGIAAGVYFTRGKPDNQPPTVLGGTDDKQAAIPTAVPATTNTKPGSAPSSTSKGNVTPTHTIDARNVGVVQPTPEPEAFEYALRSHQMHAKRRLHTY